MLENFVLMELFKRLACANRDEAVMYFRDVKKNEVDIVLEMDNADLNSIEVKALSSVSENSFSDFKRLPLSYRSGE
jgi:predicted AAA+ superfamily ATPase